MAMKWNTYRYTALALTAIMAVYPALNVSAEELGEGVGTGVGAMEGSVNTDIYQVVMPTNAEGVFDFILDPQGLINETGAAAYDGKIFEEDSTVFFRRMDGEVEEDYSSKSDAVTIVNKSSMAVDVSLKVEVVASSMEGIAMTDDGEFKDDTSASLYLAVDDGENVVPIGKGGASIETTIDAAPDGAYEYAYDSENDRYSYGLRGDLEDDVFDEYSFRLVGAANGKGDWSELTGETPEIVITWNVMPSEKATVRKDKVLKEAGPVEKGGDEIESTKLENESEVNEEKDNEINEEESQ